MTVRFTQVAQDIEWRPPTTLDSNMADIELPSSDACSPKGDGKTSSKSSIEMEDDASMTANMDASDPESGDSSSSGSTEESTAQKKKEPKPLGPWSASFILVNFISMGYILNPSGFAQGGTLLGAVCLALVSIQSIITGIFILEACTRAEMLKVAMFAGSFHQRGNRTLIAKDLEVWSNEFQTDDEIEILKQKRKSKARRWLPRSHSLRIHQRTFELSELCRIFLGRWLRNLFTATSAGDLYGITWTLAVVFGSSLSEHIPMGTDYDYQIYICIFMAITVPVSCMRISVQVPLQVMFLMARTVMLLLMLGTLAVAYFAPNAHFGTHPEPAHETPLANFSSIVTVLQLCVFSTAYQFSVPGLTSETGNKSSMVGIIVRSVTYIYATNLVLSLLMAVYFGNATETSANLNWLYYHGGTWDGDGDFVRSWWATGISSYIVLFAAFDGLSVYPLICASLGDILMGAAFEDKVHEMQENWKVRIGFRLLACVPQAVGSMFLTDLGVIAKIAGIFTVMSYTICPAYLAIQSRQAVQDAKLPTTTKYNPWFSSDWAAWILILLASALICGVFYDAFLSFNGTTETIVIRMDEDDFF